MNLRAIAAIYRFEMGRTFRTLGQSVVSPVLTTSLYFVVFGAAIGSRIEEVEGVSYGAFIVPGLIMLTVLTAGDQQRVLRHLFPEIRRHDLRASVGAGVVPGGHGGLRAGGGDQGADDRADHPRRRRSSSSTSPSRIRSGWWPSCPDLPQLRAVRVHHRHLGAEFRAVAAGAASGDHAARVPRRRVLLDLDAAGGWQTVSLFNPVVYLISGFRWSFFGLADVPVGWSLVAIGVFLGACLAAVAWIFRSGWRLRP
jgi:ABC-2 type transport system permease protein